MNFDCDIDRIRCMLDRFYRGETTADEEKAIAGFFSEADADSLPEDLAADKRLFGLLESTRPTPDQLEAPDDMLGKIAGIVDSEPVAGSRPTAVHMLRRILPFSGIAAAACIIGAIAMYAPKTPALPEDAPANGFTAYTQESGSDTVMTLTILTSEHIHPDEASQADEPAELYAGNTDGFIEITDPAEAERIALGIGQLLAHNASTTKDALAQIGHSIESYKEISKSIMQ